MSKLTKDNDLMSGKGENDVDWITVNGSHIPIKEGKKLIILPKKEYAELCSAIKTRYANKISKNSNILYKNHFYMYNYNKDTEQIIFSLKINIDGNEELIEFIRGKYGN